MATADQLQIHPGAILGECYMVEKFLGEGGFGFVTKCLHTETNKAVAIKVNKNHPNIAEQAKKEIEILKKLQCLDPDTSNIVRWNGYFFDNDHICLNFELLDQSLRDYIHGRNYRGLTTTEMRPIMHQLTTTLSHLRSTGIVHADLKPDNIMVVDRMQQPIKIKLIDFGLACPVSAINPGVCVQTVWYRAPEVILHVPFNEAIDMWSLGLVAVELATGWPLYSGGMDYDVLCYINEIQGQPPDHVLDFGLSTAYYFDQQNHGERRWILKPPHKFWEETKYWPLDTRSIVLNDLDDLEQVMAKGEEDQSERLLFVDLVKEMLQLDPGQRIKPLEVLQHPFTQSHQPDTIKDTMENKEMPEIIQHAQTARPDARIEISTENLTAESQKSTKEVVIQLDPDSKYCRIEIQAEEQLAEWEHTEEVDVQQQDTIHLRTEISNEHPVAESKEFTEEVQVQQPRASLCRTETPTVNVVDSEEYCQGVNIQPDPDAQNAGNLKGLFRWVMAPFCNCFHLDL